MPGFTHLPTVPHRLVPRNVANQLKYATDPDGNLTTPGRSLRIGGATEIAAMDVSPLTVQLLGRWDSEVYRAYVRCSRGRALSLSAAMGRAGSRPHDPTLEALFRGYTQSA